MPFEVGHTLSQGPKKQRPITDVIQRIITQDSSDEFNPSRLRKGLEKVFDAAATGDLDALTFIRDTVQGKPAQAVTLEDGDGQPVFKAIRLIIVPADQLPNQINEIPAIEGESASVAQVSQSNTDVIDLT